MRNNYRRKKSSNPSTYPRMSISDFELYVAIQLDDMVTADRCIPNTDAYGAKTFASSGLRDEGHGVVVKCKDGSKFLLQIKPLEDPEV